MSEVLSFARYVPAKYFPGTNLQKKTNVNKPIFYGKSIIFLFVILLYLFYFDSLSLFIIAQV
jgi:hypothetical protein